MKNLMSELHEKNIEVTSSRIELNQAKLKILAIVPRERYFRLENERQRMEICILEQDKLGLEVLHLEVCILM